MKVILSGGGTGGHIYPALTIADTIKKRWPETEIRFVGTTHGLEKDLVPRAGYPIDFIDFLENQIPKMISKTQKNLFILKKYEQEKKPNFTVCDLNPQEELSQLIFREDKNFFGSLSFEDKIILSDNFGNLKFYSIKGGRRNNEETNQWG